jgi:hypothetical protein
MQQLQGYYVIVALMLFINYCIYIQISRKIHMNTEQLNRFNLLTEKVINTKASLDELKEYKELLTSLNDLVAVSPLQAIQNFKNYNPSSDELP